MSSAQANALADQGVRAVAKRAYTEGIQLLTKALEAHRAPLWLIERSKAYVRVGQYADALDDAEAALHIAYNRANRDLMTDAQIRRAIALFRLQRFADADVCAYWAQRLTEGARALQDADQKNMVDNNGDYAVKLQDVKAEADRQQAEKSAENRLQAGLPQQRSRTEHQRNEALTWRIQALAAIEKLPSGHNGRKVCVEDMYPDPSNKSRTDAAADNDAASSPWELEWSRYSAEYKKNKIRYQFYQTDRNVNIDIFIKNLSQEQVAVESHPYTIKISPAEGAALGPLSGPIVILLADEINPLATECVVKSMKIALALRKKEARLWPNLRRVHAEMVDNLTTDDKGPSYASFCHSIEALGFRNVDELQLPDYTKDPTAWYIAFLEKLKSKLDHQDGSTHGTKMEPFKKFFLTRDAHEKLCKSEKEPAQEKEESAEEDEESGGGPAYPTSSKNGPKNWDNMEFDDDEDIPADGDVTSFFQKIFKDSDEDTKRAMMKSFVESNGTALSTSWNDASSKTYKTQPPDGAEAKKWE